MLKKYQIVSCDESPSYRYRLDVSTLTRSSKHLAVIQLNPSTANAKRSDPTIGKVSCWAKENEFGTITFLNLFAFRSTDPQELLKLSYDALVGPRNNDITRSALRVAATIIFAWGKLDAALAAHYKQRLVFLSDVLGIRPVYSVGKPVAGGFPRHGRMWNGENRTLMPYKLQCE